MGGAFDGVEFVSGTVFKGVTWMIDGERLLDVVLKICIIEAFLLFQVFVFGVLLELFGVI